MFTIFFKSWYLFLEMLTHKVQCYVSVILDLLLQFWTGEWCHGAKMEVACSCLPVNSVAC